MKRLLATLAAAMVLAASAWAEPAAIYGTLVLKTTGDGKDLPRESHYYVQTPHPVTVEMESDAGPVQVTTSEIQIVVYGEDRSWEKLRGKSVRVHGETWEPHNWHHRASVMLDVDPENGGSIRGAAAAAGKGAE